MRGAISDDDLQDENPDLPRTIRRMPGRSDKANQLMRRIEELDSKTPKTRRKRRDQRIVPAQQQDSSFGGCPKHAPIDFYKPEFYNSLSDSDKRRIAVPRIAFPPLVDSILLAKPHPDELLTTKELNDKYAGEVLKDYVLPGTTSSGNVEPDEYDLKFGGSDSDEDFDE